MFESELQEKFRTIFELKRVRFDHPGESNEQDTLFVNIQSSKSHVKNGRFVGRVAGKASMFSQQEKLPFGYFIKCLDSHPDDTKDLFLFDIDENSRLQENIVERGFSFVYFFDSQYDPNLGTLNSIEIEETEE